MSVLSLLVASKFLVAKVHQDPQGQPQIANAFVSVQLQAQSNPKSALEINHYITKLSSPKISPLKEWVFPYISAGYAQPLNADSASIRFRVFSQTRQNESFDEISQWANRYMLRLWNYLYFRCDLDHNMRWGRTVDVYLCEKGDPDRNGQAGSAQISDYDTFELDANDRPIPKAQIYVFKIDEAKRGIQLSRELAHEYGHALLPNVGGFEAPESYANGDVGERIFLSWLREDLKAGKLTAEDTLFTSAAQLDTYYEKSVKPLVVQTGSKGPNFPLLKERTEKSFMEYVALCTYLSRICPPMMFARFMNLNTKVAQDAENAIVSAAEEQSTWELTIPEELKGKAMYIPLVKGSVTGAKILKKSGNWAMIQPEANKKVTIKNPPLPPQSQNLK